MPEWATRIVDHGEASPEDLVPNPANWRQHPKAQAEALTKALERVGWVQSVIVNKTTGRLVDGHLRARLALAAGATAIPVSYVELSEAEEKVVLATLDPLGALAVSDDSALYGLLSDVSQSDKALAGMIGWLRQEAKAPTTPSQDSIDRHAEQLANRFKDGPDGTGIEVSCPECGMEFGLAGIGITS